VGGWGEGIGWLIIRGAYNRNLTVSFYKFYYNKLQYNNNKIIIKCD
jgi:hypothetical protein